MTERLEDLKWQRKFYERICDHARNKNLYWKIVELNANVMIKMRKLEIDNT